MSELITIVICTYNRAPMLARALESLDHQNTDDTFTVEILVVDDCSTDDTENVVQSIVQSSRNPVRYVRGQGQGIAAARNMGISAALGEWIAFFDDDQIADGNWLKELRACASLTGGSVVGGAVRVVSDARVGVIDPNYRSMLGQSDGARPMGECDRDTFPGCGSMLVKACVFARVGRFDESLTRGGEDIEFGARVRLAGLKVWFTPKSIMYHYMPPHRLTENHLLWRAQRCGANFAFRDYCEWGIGRTLLVCFARVVQASGINLPILVLAYLCGAKWRVLRGKWLILRAWGYFRYSLHLSSPRIFPQGAYLSGLSMRSERSIVT